MVQPHEKSVGPWGLWSSSPLAPGQVTFLLALSLALGRHHCNLAELPRLLTMGWDKHYSRPTSKAGAQLPCPFLQQQPDTPANAAVGPTAWPIAPGAPHNPESSPLPANPSAIAVVPHVIAHTVARKWRITASLCKSQLLCLLWISKHNQAYFLIICKCTFEIWAHLLDWGTHKKQTMKTVKLQGW